MNEDVFVSKVDGRHDVLFQDSLLEEAAAGIELSGQVNDLAQNKAPYILFARSLSENIIGESLIVSHVVYL